MRYIVSLMLVLVLSGCGVYSKYPVTPFDKSQMDSKIYGTWIWEDNGELGYIHIGLNEDSELLKVLTVVIHEDGEIASMEFEGHTSSVDKNRYLNLRLTHPAEERIDDYIIVSYRVNADTLSIGIMESSVVVKAIRDGSLKGMIQKERFFTSAFIRESGEKLQKFLVEHDKVLFPEMKDFGKIELSKLNSVLKVKVER